MFSLGSALVLHPYPMKQLLREHILTRRLRQGLKLLLAGAAFVGATGFQQGGPPLPPPSREGFGYRSNMMRQDEALNSRRAGRIVPLEHVLQVVEHRFPGRLLDAGLETDRNGRVVYVVRWASRDGRRLDIFVDAATAEILGVR